MILLQPSLVSKPSVMGKKGYIFVMAGDNVVIYNRYIHIYLFVLDKCKLEFCKTIETTSKSL
jgi:hypothetical protein